MKHIKLFENWVSESTSDMVRKNDALKFSELVAQQFNNAKIENPYLDANEYPHLRYLNLEADPNNSGTIIGGTNQEWYNGKSVLKDLEVSPAAYVISMGNVEGTQADWDLWLAFEDNRIIPFATISEGWHDIIVGKEFSDKVDAKEVAMAIAEICNNDSIVKGM